MTQWYPKPAVYDHKGWHPMPYLNQGEFYSEFGTFDVKITLPQDYRIMATGDIIGGDDYFEDGIIDRILPNLQDEKIYIGKMRCFSDGNGSTIGISNIKETLMKRSTEEAYNLVNTMQ